MKAAIFHGPGQKLRIEDIPDPVPAGHEVVLKVGRCGICGSDVTMTSGQGPMFQTGCALGHEYAGEVVEIGRNVQRLRVGDRITALPMSGCGACEACRAGRPLACAAGMWPMMGGFGEYTLADERLAVRLPETLSMADGALVEPLACALRGVAMAGIKPADRVLVLGVGAIGAGAIFWARRLGAGRIVGSARSGFRASLAGALGADAFVPSAALNAELADALGGPPDLVFECTGAAGMIASAIDLVRPGGTVLCLGICNTVDQFAPAMAAGKEVILRFSLAYSLRNFQDTVAALDAGALAPRAMVEATVGLDDVPDLLEAMRAGIAKATKILVDPWAAGA
jgi:(R,R)-butanediol dehydrogenase/meso-butanediol dehydrogenase/diacetyl reductase